MGRELNPHLGALDLKVFADLRPGLIGWTVLNISMACEQAVRRGGSILSVTDSMLLVLAFEGWYVFDALYNEVSRHNLYYSLLHLTGRLTCIDCHSYYHGYCNRRSRIYVGRRKLLLGAIYIQHSIALSCFPSRRTGMG